MIKESVLAMLFMTAMILIGICFGIVFFSKYSQDYKHSWAIGYGACIQDFGGESRKPNSLPMP